MTGQMLGTPSYMAPEQASPDPDEPLGPATDVYALGTVLYHLIVGRPPFQAERPELTISHLLHREPPSPRILVPSIPKDLETICLRCLEKRPAKRYASAADLAHELKRFLDGKAIHARPPTGWERLRRWGRQNRALTVAVLSSLLMLVIGFGTTLWQWYRAEQASEAKGEALQHVFLQRVEDLFRTDRTQAGMALLARVLRDNPNSYVPVQRAVSSLTYREFALPLTGHLQHDGAVIAVEYDPAGTFLATASSDRTVRLWEAATGRALGEPLQHDSELTLLDMDASGERLATASQDGSVWLWEISSRRELFRFQHDGAVLDLQFDSSGKLLATASEDQTASVWDLERGVRIHGPLKHGGYVNSVQFNKAGTQLLTASQDDRARLWNLEDPSQAPIQMQHEQRVLDARFGPDDQRVATASWDGRPTLWDSQTGERLISLSRHESWVTRVSWSPDGRRIATAGSVGKAYVWDSETGERVGDGLPHVDSPAAIVFDPNGKRLATGQRDGLYLWDVETDELILTIWHSGIVRSLDFSPDGQFLAVASEGGHASICQILNGSATGTFKQHPDQVYGYWSPDGSQILAVCFSGEAWLYDAETLKPTTPPLLHPSILTYGGYSSCGDFVLTTSREKQPNGKRGGALRVWDARDGSLVSGPVFRDRMIWSGVFSPDGTKVAAASWDGTAQVWDARTGVDLTEPLRHEKGVHFVAFNADGTELITGSGEKGAKVWDVPTSTLTRVLSHQESVHHAEFSADGSRVITASDDRTARIWDTATGQPLS